MNPSNREDQSSAGPSSRLPDESIVFQVVDDFAKTCRTAVPSDLRPFVRDLPDSEPERLVALVGMIKIALERHWLELDQGAAIGPAAFVEHYLEQFPELTRHPELILTLVQAEFD